jgi:hypothetical protein
MEKLLLSAYSLDGGNGNHFSAEDLVVAAWKHFPRAFGLRGHNDEAGLSLYPDSNRVFAEIMGSKPIRKRGLLTKTGIKMYALTTSGRDEAQQLAAGQDGAGEVASQSGKASISRAVRSRLERLLSSRAVHRAQAGELDRITFHDACLFWGITARSSAIELEGALADTRATIEAAEDALGGGASELRTGKGDLSVSATDLLRKVHDSLQQKFAEEFGTIRKRRDQRKI